MLRYVALAISLGIALAFQNTAPRAAPVDCYSACNDLGTSASYDDRYDCDDMVDEPAGDCPDVVNSYANDADAPPYRRYGREPVRHPVPGRIVPDASFFGLY